jgi:phosphatidylserine/phosphatidylglycerophosphate/cardiolipin synthase-like enzyme
MLHRVAPDRVGVFDLENRWGTPIYVHAKICIIDDAWFTCGSDNFNRRSWTTDSELTCAVLDTAADNREPHGADTSPDASRPLAHGLRLQLWAEHLGLDQNDPQLHDPAAGLKLWNTTADALDRWHETGSRSPRPTGHVRRHTPEPVPTLQRLWADPISRLIVDPDGRPRRLRGTSQF